MTFLSRIIIDEGTDYKSAPDEFEKVIGGKVDWEKSSPREYIKGRYFETMRKQLRRS